MRTRETAYKPGERIRITQDHTERDGTVWLAAGELGTVIEVARSAGDEYNRTDGRRTPLYRVVVELDARGPGSRVGFKAASIELAR